MKNETVMYISNKYDFCGDQRDVGGEDEKVLFERAQKGDREAEEVLFAKHIKSIPFALKKYGFLKMDFIDDYEYESECQLALLNCIRNYDYNSDVKFITYVMQAHYHAMKRVTDKQSALSRYDARNEISLDENVSGGEVTEESESNLYDFLSDGSYEEEREKEVAQALVEKIKYLIPEKQFNLLYLASIGFTYRQISKKVNINPSRVGQIISSIRSYIRMSFDYANKVNDGLNEGLRPDQIALKLGISYERTMEYKALYDYIYNCGPLPKIDKIRYRCAETNPPRLKKETPAD